MSWMALARNVECMDDRARRAGMSRESYFESMVER